MNELSRAIKAVIGFVRLSFILLIAIASKKMTGATMVMKGRIYSDAR